MYAQQGTSRALRLAIGSALALGLAHAPAYAADAPQVAGTLEEIEVTATKRGDESVLSVPVAIQAISGADLERRGQVEFADFAGQVPSLSYADLGPGDKKYVIRGITSTGPATVGVYYDEAVITASNAQDGGGRNADIRLFDLDRIEVLKGPQGTLYGASSMSGTIRYITKKPVLDKIEGSVGAEYSSTSKGDDNYLLNGTLNLPIVDNVLGLRATGWTVDNSGFIDQPRIPAGRVENSNDEKTRGGRVTLRWQPSDAFNLTATATTQTLSTGGSARYTPPGATSFGNAGAGFPSIPGGDLVNTDLTLSPWDEKLNVFGLTAEYHTSAGTLTATTNYFKRHIDFAFDSSPILFFFGVPVPAVTLQPQERKIISSEVRWASSLDGPVNFVAGVFQQHEKNDFRVEVVKTNVFGVQNGPFSPLDSDDALQNPNGNTFFGRFDNNKVNQYAGFGEVTWAITDALSVTGGVRYFHSKQDSEQDTTHPFGGFGPNIPVGVQKTSGTASKTTFKGNVSYKFDDKKLAYFTAAQGFRVGGTNSADLPFVSGDIPRTFDPDSLWNYEVGYKAEYFDGRLQFSTALYEIRWSDIQVAATDATSAFLFTTNAGSAKVDGVELEITALLAPGLVLDFGGAYTNAKLTADQPVLPNNPNLGRDGDRLPKVPKIQGSLGLTYTVPVGAASLSLHGDMSYRDGVNTQFNPNSVFNVKLDSYALLNLRASLDWNQWTLSAFARNVGDKRAQVDAISSDQDPLARITVRPRTVGIALQRKF